MRPCGFLVAPLPLLLSLIQVTATPVAVTVSTDQTGPLSTLDSRDACYDFIVMTYPGAYDAPGVRMRSTVSNIMSGMQGYKGMEFITQYNPPTPSTIVDMMQPAAYEVVTYVKKTYKACPKTRIALFGFSFGSFPVMWSLSNASLPRAPMSAVLLFGNAYWLPDQRQNKGTAKTGVSAHAGELRVPANYLSITEDWCDFGDYFCSGAQYTGKPDDPHLNYQNTAAHIEGAAFVVKRLKEDIAVMRGGKKRAVKPKEGRWLDAKLLRRWR